VAAEHKEEKEL